MTWFWAEVGQFPAVSITRQQDRTDQTRCTVLASLTCNFGPFGSNFWGQIAPTWAHVLAKVELPLQNGIELHKSHFSFFCNLFNISILLVVQNYTLRCLDVPYTLDVTDWVAYFVLPGDPSEAVIVEGENWTGAPKAADDPERLDDLVFSWTVDGKGGVDPTVPPTWEDDDPDPPTVLPEPSSVILFLSGLSFMLLRRQRKG